MILFDFDKKYKDERTINFLNYINITQDRDDIKFKKSADLERLLAFHSDERLSDEIKTTRMLTLCPSITSLVRDYNFLLELENDPEYSTYLDQYREIYSEYDKIFSELYSTFEKPEELNEKESDDYYLACYFVSQYINYSSSFYVGEFLREFGLNKLEFNSYLKLVEKYNLELYNKYYIKNLRNRADRVNEVYDKVNNLYNAVNGFFEVKKGNGKEQVERIEFDELEFYRNLPFYDSDTCEEVAYDFKLKATSTRAKFRELLDYTVFPSNEIINYMYKNKIFNYSNFERLFNENYIFNTRFIFAGNNVLTDEDKKAILKYMKDNKIPPILNAFNIVSRRYLAGELLGKEKLIEKG